MVKHYHHCIKVIIFPHFNLRVVLCRIVKFKVMLGRTGLQRLHLNHQAWVQPVMVIR